LEIVCEKEEMENRAQKIENINSMSKEKEEKIKKKQAKLIISFALIKS